MTRLNQAAQKEIATKHLPHLAPNEQAGLVAFVDRLRQHYGPDLLHVVLLLH